MRKPDGKVLYSYRPNFKLVAGLGLEEHGLRSKSSVEVPLCRSACDLTPLKIVTTGWGGYISADMAIALDLSSTSPVTGHLDIE